MRLGVIGTSHIATLKLGWEILGPQHPGIATTFFGAPLGKLAGLKPQGERLASADPATRALLAASSGGIEDIAPKDFDAILLAGMRLYLPRLDARMSQALRDTALADVIAEGLAPRLAKRFRRLAPVPLYFAPEPLWADLPRYRRGEGHLLPYAEVLAGLQSRLPLRRAKILPQPEKTISAALLTKLAYSVETEPLEQVEASGRAFDQVHMNAEFGAAWWEANLPELRAGF